MCKVLCIIGVVLIENNYQCVNIYINISMFLYVLSFYDNNAKKLTVKFVIVLHFYKTAMTVHMVIINCLNTHFYCSTHY